MLYRERMQKEEEKTGNYSFWRRIGYILTRWDFVVILITLTCFYLISAVIHYWLTDYLVSVLGQSKEQAFVINVIVSVGGYASGVALSGCVFDRIGGYHGRNAPLLFTVFMILSGVLGICSTFTHNVYVASTCILF